MTETSVQTLISHNTWATRALIDAAADLAPDQFHRRFDIGHGSLHDTLRHIVATMLEWAARIADRPVRESIEGDEHQCTPQHLSAMLAQADADLREVATALDAGGRWHESMALVVEGGPTFRFQRITAMLHVLTHGMHHRAQAVNIRRQLELEPLGFDLDVVEWECVQTGQLD